MARKDVVRTQLLTSQDMSSSFNSPITLIRNLDNCSYQINITTTDSIGTFAVQGSNDYGIYGPTNLVENTGNWIDLDLSGVPFANAADDSILINLNQLPFNAIRIAYTATTPGTGTLDLWIVCKQVGG